MVPAHWKLQISSFCRPDALCITGQSTAAARQIRARLACCKPQSLPTYLCELLDSLGGLQQQAALHHGDAGLAGWLGAGHGECVPSQAVLQVAGQAAGAELVQAGADDVHHLGRASLQADGAVLRLAAARGCWSSLVGLVLGVLQARISP